MEEQTSLFLHRGTLVLIKGVKRVRQYVCRMWGFFRCDSMLTDNKIGLLIKLMRNGGELAGRLSTGYWVILLVPGV